MEDREKEAKKWIENVVQQKVIKSIPWSELKIDTVTNIGEGRFGSVFKVYWENDHSYVACKKLDVKGKMWETFKHELYMQIRVHSCENIIRVLGISKSKSLIYFLYSII